MIVKGRYNGNQIILGVERNNECRLILPSFFALAFENELGWHYLQDVPIKKQPLRKYSLSQLL